MCITLHLWYTLLWLNFLVHFLKFTSLYTLMCLCCYLVYLLLLFSHWVVSDSFRTPWTVACQAPLSMGYSLQARILERVAISFSRASSNPGIKPALTGGFFTTDLPGKPLVGLLTRTFISMIIFTLVWALALNSILITFSFLSTPISVMCSSTTNQLAPF